MRGRLLTVLVCFLISTNARGAENEAAKDTASIKKHLIAGFNISQTSYRNWAAGGEDALSWVTQLDAGFEIKRRKTRTAMSLQVEFGQIQHKNEKPRVSENKIHYDAVFTYLIGTFLNPFMAFKMDTQVTRGFDYQARQRIPKADFLDPLIIQQSTGVGFSPLKEMKTRFGVALKETYTDEFSRYSDNPDTPGTETFKFETGIDHTTEINAKLSEKLTLFSKLELFSSFEQIDVVDIRWQNTLRAKMAKFIAVNVKANYLYDRDVSLRGQFMHSITFGLSYDFL